MNCFKKIQSDCDFNIMPTRAAASPAASSTAKPEHVTQHVSQIAKIIHVDVDTLKTAKAACALPAKTRLLRESRMAELVVLRAFLVITKHLVRLVDLFKLRGISTLIRMQLMSLLAKGFFYLILARAFGNAELFVIITWHNMPLVR